MQLRLRNFPVGFVFIFLLLSSEWTWSQKIDDESLWSRKKGVDWPSFLGPGHDSKSSEKGILKDWSGENLKIKWVKKLAESYGIGSVAQGRFFQFDRVDGHEVLFCLNAETGKEIWKKSYSSNYRDLYGYNAGPRTSPVVDSGRVYTLGVAGDLRCYNVTDGSLVWHDNVNQKFGVIQNFFGVGSTPVIYKDLLIVMVGGSPEESKSAPPGALDQVKGNGSAIVAFEKANGEIRYKLSSELASYSSPVIASINNVDWCFAWCRGGLIGFDPVNGKQRFHYPWRDSSMESVNASNPVVVGDTVLISETYGIGSSYLKVKQDGVDVIWKDEKRSRERAMETHWNTAVFHKGYFYGSSGRHSSNAVLKCIESNTG
ncbi:MAG: PQQ-binding-like beta-propeller repeat protein, partial [Planctomycetota bacterium]|nr:PQQ-binding-like beta-propeller repeat protein [Planctomycetota bacterium]